METHGSNPRNQERRTDVFWCGKLYITILSNMFNRSGGNRVAFMASSLSSNSTAEMSQLVLLNQLTAQRPSKRQDPADQQKGRISHHSNSMS